MSGPVRRAPPPSPLELVNPAILAVKSGAATALALLFDVLTGNPDRVTSAFLSVMCTSPTVIMGLRRSFTYLVCSALGAGVGTTMVLGRVPAHAGVPAAVAISVWLCFRIGRPMGYLMAAFSALIVQLVPRGTPLETVGVRMLAVFTATLSGFLVNLAVSSSSYRTIFARRLARIEVHVDALLGQAATEGPESVRPGFALIRTLSEELAHGLEELEWRGDRVALEYLQRIHDRVEFLQHLLHLVLDVGLTLELAGKDPTAAREFLAWLRDRRGPPPEAPDGARGPVRRILELVRLQGRGSIPEAVAEVTAARMDA